MTDLTHKIERHLKAHGIQTYMSFGSLHDSRFNSVVFMPLNNKNCLGVLYIPKVILPYAEPVFARDFIGNHMHSTETYITEENIDALLQEYVEQYRRCVNAVDSFLKQAVNRANLKIADMQNMPELKSMTDVLLKELQAYAEQIQAIDSM